MILDYFIAQPIKATIFHEYYVANLLHSLTKLQQCCIVRSCNKINKILYATTSQSDNVALRGGTSKVNKIKCATNA